MVSARRPPGGREERSSGAGSGSRNHPSVDSARRARLRRLGSRSRSGAAARRDASHRRCPASQQRPESLSRDPRLGPVHGREARVGRIQRRRDRPRRPDDLGRGPVHGGDHARLPRDERQPRAPLRWVRKGDQELRRRDVRLAAWSSRRPRRKHLGDRRARDGCRRPQDVSPRAGQGQYRGQVQPRWARAHDDWHTRRQG